MKPPQPPCELANHDIKLEMIACPAPYLGIRCHCQTCGAEWLENYHRIYIGEATKAVPATPVPQLELI
jgi:hypothetical protein